MKIATARVLLFSIAVAASLCGVGPAWGDDDAVAVEHRLTNDLKYLSSDDLEGRGPGTAGIDKAANYLVEEFKKLGLKTDVFGGEPFQKFKLTTEAELGTANDVMLVGPGGGDGTALALKLKADYSPLGLGGSGTIYLPLAFVGYGITAEKEKYDDYAGIDVKGKAVVILRHEPQQEDDKSVFNGSRTSEYAPLVKKLSNAYEHGAAAVIFVTDEHEIAGKKARAEKRWVTAVDKLAAAHAEFKKIETPTPEQIEAHRAKIGELWKDVTAREAKIATESDPVLEFTQGGTDEMGRSMPVLHMRRGVIDQAIKASMGKDLSTLEKEIDQGPTPKSGDLTGWRIAGTVDVKKKEIEVKNVAAVLEGSGPHADETIVIGAHYDHLGYGGSGSLAPGDKSIHNGADDNASGTTALLEVARRIAALGPQPRRIVFMAFTAEERGLIGSAYYVKNPVFPLDNTVAMLNMDMVGRLTDDKLIIQGVDTSPQFGELIDGLNEKYQFKLTKQSGGFGPSDHSSFYGAKIPVMHYFTDLHSDYHRPSDDWDKINYAGMRRIVELVADSAIGLAKAEERPEYVSVSRSRDRNAEPRDGDRPYFGSVPDFGQTVEGYAISAVTEDSPAAKGGLQGGDVVIQLGESRVGNLDDFDSALRKHKAGEKVKVVVRRSGQDVTLEVELGDPR